MHKIVHTEFVTSNPKRTADFFTELFGWEMHSMEGMEYIVWNYPDAKEGGGGIYDSKEPHTGFSTLEYIEVENITKSLAKAVELGATVHTEEQSIGEHGYIGVFTEPGGCTIGLWAKNPSK